MVRPHHPFKGRRLELVRGGPKQVVVRLPDGTTTRMPRSWTDLDGTPVGTERPDLVCAQRELVELADLVAALLRRGEGRG